MNGQQPMDVFAHSNPAFAASVLRWLCEGFAEERRRDDELGSTGLLSIWALSALVLLATDEIRPQLPKTSKKRLSNLFHEHPSWRPALFEGVGAWAGSFWRGVGYGSSKGLLQLEKGCLYASGKLQVPTDEWTKGLRGRARTLGRVLACERDDAVLGSAFGLNVTGNGH